MGHNFLSTITGRQHYLFCILYLGGCVWYAVFSVGLGSFFVATPHTHTHLKSAQYLVDAILRVCENKERKRSLWQIKHGIDISLT